MASVVGIIPARWASSRFPGKPLYHLAGRPLLEHVWRRCQEAAVFDRVLVATDDQRIGRVARQFGADVIFTSPHHPSGTDRVAEAANTLDAEFVFNVQGDEPLIEPLLLRQLTAALADDPASEIVTAATPVSVDEAASPHVVKVALDRSAHALYFSRSIIPYPREPVTLLRHLGIYGYRRRSLLAFVRTAPGELEQTERLEQLRALENGMKIRVIVSQSASIGVDTPEDAAVVERILLGQTPRAPGEAQSEHRA